MVNFLKDIFWCIVNQILKKTETFDPSTVDPHKIHSVLVIRPDRLGDVILSTPIYESIKRFSPTTRITVLVHQDQEEVLRDNPFIDRVISFRRAHPLKIYRDLKEESFDLTIVPNQVFSATAATLALLSQARFRAGYANSCREYVFHINVPKSKEIKHETQHNIDLLRFLGYPTIGKAPAVYFNNEVAQKIEALLFENNRYPDRPLVLVKPGTRVPQWGWSLNKFRTVSNDLLENGQAEVFIITGPKEESLVASLAMGVAHPPVILPVLTIRELAYLIKRADLLFCNHTGIMHLASAVKTPMVVVFKHGDVNRWGPCQTQNIVLNERDGEGISTDSALQAIRELTHHTSSRPLRNFSQFSQH